MKKIVGIIAAAALATTAFAEINIGSWNRASFVPVAYDGDVIRSLEGTNWEGVNASTSGIRTGLGFSASSENAGVVMDLHNNTNTLALGDNGYAWVRPVEMLRVALGKVDNNWGRADVCFGMYDHAWRYSNLPNGEGIGGTGRSHGSGANLTLTPVEGLVIDYQTGDCENNYYWNTLWYDADFMIGYQADFGFIRAILRPDLGTNKDGDDAPFMNISVAADITAVENLKLTVAATVPTAFDVYASSWEYELPTTTPAIAAAKDIMVWANAVSFGVGASYDLDPIVIHGFFDGKINPKEFDDDDAVKIGEFGFAIAAGVDFKINDTFTLITDFRFMNDKYNFKGLNATTALAGGNKEAIFHDASIGAYVGFAQTLTNATFDFGVQIANNYCGASASDDGITFAVPVGFTVSF